MNNELVSVLSAFHSSDPVAAETVRRLMGSSDLRGRGVAYHLLQRARDRITPPLSTAEQCSFMLDYLFECIRSDSESDEYLHSGFEAAWELAEWVRLLERAGENGAFVSQIVQRLTETFVAADENTRDRIETGAVEHMMELPSMRKYFDFWKSDPRLSTAYELCLQWGKDHEEHVQLK
ncbi:MAG: hypothetical protein AB7G28_16795 [Pirellulales bacterium]